MPVQRLPWDTRFGDLRLRPAQCRLGEAQPGRCHLERPPVVPAAGTRRFQTGAGALDDQFALELGEASKKLAKISRPLAVVVSIDAPSIAGTKHLASNQRSALT